jgi:hypothetical protein
MNNLKLICISAGILLLFFSKVKAQGNVDSEVIIVTSETKKIVLPQANRNFEEIRIETPKQNTAPQIYNTENVMLNLPRLETKIKINSIKPPAAAVLYGNYVKAGFGNYASSYLEGFFNSKRSDNVLYGAHVKHFSSLNGPVSNSGFSDNKVDAYGKYFGDKFTLKGNLNYSRNRYNFYGYNKEQPVNKDSLKQVFNVFSAVAGIENQKKDSKLNYDFNLGYYYFMDHYKARESEILLTGSSRYKISDDKFISTSSMVSISSRTDSTTIGRRFYQVKPAFNIIIDKLTLRTGINVAYTDDPVGNKFHMYPSVNADYAVIPQRVTAFAGIDGEMQKNVLRTFVSQNPYLKSNVELLHTNKTFELYAGAKGNIAGKLNYKARIAYLNYKNLFFFNNSAVDTSKFDILYAKGPSSVMNLTGELSYELNQRFRISMVNNYYKYSISPDTLKPWQRPSFTSSVIATYNLRDKILLNLDIYYISGLSGKNYKTNHEVKLPDIVDINFKVDYRVSKAFSTFLEFNNLLGKKYQRYLYYPVKSINILAGLTYSF